MVTRLPRIGVTTMAVADPADPRHASSPWVTIPVGEEAQGVRRAYLDALADAGAMTVLLAQDVPAAAAEAVADLDGLVFSGGEDIDSRLYGQPRHPKTRPNPWRDAWELALFAQARARGLPVLAICRGLQLVTVALGGSLLQHLPEDLPDHPVPASPTTRRRDLDDLLLPVAGTRTAALLGSAPIPVNSLHHQGIATLPPDLVAAGHTPDGLVEAVESPPGAPFLLGVQCHPEELRDAAPWRAWFRAFVAEAAAFAEADRDAPRLVPGDQNSATP